MVLLLIVVFLVLLLIIWKPRWGVIAGLVSLVMILVWSVLATDTNPGVSLAVASPTASASPGASTAPAPTVTPAHQSISGTVNTYLATPALQTSGLDGQVTHTLSADPPAGMSFDSTTGVLSGTPTQTTGHTYTVTSKGQTTEASSTLHVNVTATSAPAGTVSPTKQTLHGQVGHFTSSGKWKLHGIDGTVKYALSQSPPPGLSFSSTTGVLSGTPGEKVDKTYTVTITGSNTEVKADLTVTITSPTSPATPETLSPASQNVTGTIGSPMSSAPMSAGGFPSSPAVTYALSPAAPAGLIFDASTGELSGTPTATVSQAFTITASNGTDRATASLGVTVTDPASTASAQATAPPNPIATQDSSSATSGSGSAPAPAPVAAPPTASATPAPSLSPSPSPSASVTEAVIVATPSPVAPSASPTSAPSSASASPSATPAPATSSAAPAPAPATSSAAPAPAPATSSAAPAPAPAPPPPFPIPPPPSPPPWPYTGCMDWTCGV